MRVRILFGLLFFTVTNVWAQREVRLAPFASGFGQLTHITNAGDGSNRLFVVEQAGRVRIIKRGIVLNNPFLDIADRVSCCSERGLLSIAFPPGYAAKKRFYASYTDVAGNSMISMFLTSSNADVADASSEVHLLSVQQPFSNHNGGMMAFGPDGYLYIGFGDGGGNPGGDPFGNGQNPNTLLGKLVRIDVESVPGTYRVPATNPFIGRAGYRPEIWALGLRNPWKFSFDRTNGNLYIADVGESFYEEVNFQAAGTPGGQNYGWNTMEGMHCYLDPACSTAGLTLPVTEYGHGADCSVTGGYVFRSPDEPGLEGVYLYADYCSGTIRGLTKNGGAWQSSILLDSRIRISTFGEDEAGNLYVTDYDRGRILKVKGTRFF